MPNKIAEIIIEPSKVFVNSTFRLKIKATRYATYQELKNKETYNSLKNFNYSELKGD